MRPRDTSRAAHRAQLEVYRRMDSTERLALALQLSDDLRAVLADGVRIRHPEYDAESVRSAVLRLSLGDKLFRTAFPVKNPVTP